MVNATPLSRENAVTSFGSRFGPGDEASLTPSATGTSQLRVCSFAFQLHSSVSAFRFLNFCFLNFQFPLFAFACYFSRHMNSDMHMDGHLTVLGWTNFALYLVAALLAFRAAFVSSRLPWSSETGRIWIWLGIILAVLGLNKQLDLQTLLIELGRQGARREHLLEYRPELHVLFFLGFILGIIALFVAVRFRLPGHIGRFGRQLPWAAGGCAMVCAYIVIRATSIEHIDQMLGFDLEQIPFLWLLEAGGLLLIIVQALGKPDKFKN
jgi:hypothetical protein